MQLFIALKTGTDPEPLDDEVAQENQKEDKYSRESLDKQLNESLDKTVLTNKPNVTWDDVAGLAEAKMELQIAAEMPKKFQQLFRGKREPQRFILLYGPPGTGKGQLIKALASGVNSTLFTISSSDVQSKWVGESERSVIGSSIHSLSKLDMSRKSHALSVGTCRLCYRCLFLLTSIIYNRSVC
jgi:SpoVK/Ycf46/Vps4 family AAA+-type ATPase